jgi:flavorubredoxin
MGRTDGRLTSDIRLCGGCVAYISFSQFESDECGSLNEWLAAAPKADASCSQLAARVNDFISRASHALADGGTFFVRQP